MYSLILVCLIGQVPPPPVPQPPTQYRAYNSERDWLTNNLIVDHPALANQIKDKMSHLSDEEVHQLAEYYRQQVAAAQAQLQQLIVQRNALRQEIQDRVNAENQRITEYGSALANAQFNALFNNGYWGFGGNWNGWNGNWNGWNGNWHHHGYVAPRVYVAPPRVYVAPHHSGGRHR